MLVRTAKGWVQVRDLPYLKNKVRRFWNAVSLETLIFFLQIVEIRSSLFVFCDEGDATLRKREKRI